MFLMPITKSFFPFVKNNIHWYVGEIWGEKKEDNNYVFKLIIHNPYGGGDFWETFPDDFSSIKKSLSKRFGENRVEIQPTISRFNRRQEERDAISCGIIVVDDCFKLIKGQSLNIDQPYGYGAIDLRKNHIQFVRTAQNLKTNAGSPVISLDESDRFLKKNELWVHQLESSSHVKRGTQEPLFTSSSSSSSWFSSSPAYAPSSPPNEDIHSEEEEGSKLYQKLSEKSTLSDYRQKYPEETSSLNISNEEDPETFYNSESELERPLIDLVKKITKVLGAVPDEIYHHKKILRDYKKDLPHEAQEKLENLLNLLKQPCEVLDLDPSEKAYEAFYYCEELAFHDALTPLQKLILDLGRFRDTASGHLQIQKSLGYFIKIYQDYKKKLHTSQPNRKERLELLQPQVEVKALGMKPSWISQAKARQLAGKRIYNSGHIKTNAQGTHPVIGLGGVHFKAHLPQHSSLAPIKEMASYFLHHRLFGGGVVPSTWILLKNVNLLECPKDINFQLALQEGFSPNGETPEEYLYNRPDLQKKALPQKEVFYIQATLTTSGKPLDLFMEEAEVHARVTQKGTEFVAFSPDFQQKVAPALDVLIKGAAGYRVDYRSFQESLQNGLARKLDKKEWEDLLKEHLSCKDFLPYLRQTLDIHFPLDDNKMYPFMQDFFQRVATFIDEKKYSLEQINEDSLAAHILGSFFINLGDAKGDNYFITLEDTPFQLIGIDNDWCGEPEIKISSRYSDRYVCTSRNIFYCTPDWMLQKLPEKIRKHLLTLDPYVILCEWMSFLNRYHQASASLISRTLLSPDLQKTLKSSSETDVLSWFRKIVPGIGIRENVLNSFNHPLIPEEPSERKTLEQLVEGFNRFQLMPEFYPQFGNTFLARFIYLQKLLKESNRTYQSLFDSLLPISSLYYKTLLEKENSPLKNLEKVYEASQKQRSILEGVDPETILDIPEVSNLNPEGGIHPVSLKQYLETLPYKIPWDGADTLEYATAKEIIENLSVENLPFPLAHRLVSQGAPLEIFKFVFCLLPDCLHEKDKNLGNSALHFLVEQPFPDGWKKEILDFFLGQGLDPNAINKNRESPLTVAIKKKDLFMFEELVKQGAGQKTGGRELYRFYEALKQEKTLTDSLKKAIYHLCQVNQKRSWEFSLDQILPEVQEETSEPCLDTSSHNKRYISASVRKEILDDKGKNLRRSTLSGRHAVTSVSEEMSRIYFKAYPELPGFEIAVGEITRRLIGFGAPYAELSLYDDSMPVLLTQGIKGETLDEVLREDPERLQHLVLDDVHKMILVAILLNPEDGKPDNYIVEPHPHYKGKYRLTCIDNDHAFVPAIAREGDKWAIRVKCILYCLDEMTKNLSTETLRHISEMDFETITTDWLKRLAFQDSCHEALFVNTGHREDVRSIFKNNDCFVKVLFTDQMIGDFYYKYTRLQSLARKVLKENLSITPIEILRKIEPRLAQHYEKVLSRDINPRERFLEADGKAYGRQERGLQSQIDSLQVLESLGIPDKRSLENILQDPDAYTPAKALKVLERQKDSSKLKELPQDLARYQNKNISSFLDRLQLSEIEFLLRELDWQNLNPRTQGQLLNWVAQKKISFLKIKNCPTIKDSYFVGKEGFFLGIGKITLPKYLDYLSTLCLDGCHNLTSVLFRKIPVLFPNLEKLFLNRMLLPKKISYSFEGIRVLNLDDNSGIVSIDINVPIQGSKLERFEMSRCGNLQEVNFAKIPSSLRKISLKNNPSLEEKCLKKIACQTLNVPNVSFRDSNKGARSSKIRARILSRGKVNLSQMSLTRNHLILIRPSLYNITDLDLSKNYFKDKGTKALSPLIDLTNLNLHDNGIGPNGAKALSSLTNLKKLNLSNNHVGLMGAKALSSLTNLIELNLESNLIGPEAARYFSSLINLKILNLSYNQIMSEGTQYLAYLPNLTELNLENDFIYGDGIKALNLLKNLKVLNLRRNHICVVGIRALSSLTNLIELDLYNNGIGPDGAKALYPLTNLKKLNLDSNGIGNDGAKALYPLTKLKDLNLRYNHIGDNTAQELKEILSETNIVFH